MTLSRERSTDTAAVQAAEVKQDSWDLLFGCEGCGYKSTGCPACKAAPAMARPAKLRWKPDEGRPQLVSSLQLELFKSLISSCTRQQAAAVCKQRAAHSQHSAARHCRRDKSCILAVLASTSAWH